MWAALSSPRFGALTRKQPVSKAAPLSGTMSPKYYSYKPFCFLFFLAGLLALRILGTSRPELLEAMMKYQEGMKETVMEKAERLETVSWKNY